ncbi:aminoglycoside 6-adenylyltransferase [Paenibacillus oryzisoli]|uniref:aminoglycoside 6-adenylyltransferase n=1 Tax=Paenibacillus oryzisoli TaxID=1850517 RepID=UPI003D27DB40
MRTEQQMMSLILDTAEQDETIRAVILNGSRANPNVPKDTFQDFDIVYAVANLAPYRRNPAWIDRFGERLILQMPDETHIDPAASPPEEQERIVYLMQFKDGNRIDLTLMPTANAAYFQKLDSLSIVLLDKDGRLGEVPPSSDSDYHIRRPSEKVFRDNCNEFWWICLNIGKGLRREELSYVMFLLESINRKVLIRMLEWRIGAEAGFVCSAGKSGKYLQRFLTPADWTQFQATYANADYAQMWQALFQMCDLFGRAAKEVAERLGFTYHQQEEVNVMAYLHEVCGSNKRIVF